MEIHFVGHFLAIFAPAQLGAVFHFDFHFFPFRLLAVFHAMPARQDPNPTTPKIFFLSTSGSALGSALAVKCHQRVQVIKVFNGNSWNNRSSSESLCLHATTVCFKHNSHWLLSRVQGCCLEPKWQWPFWYSPALFRLSSCIHPIDGVVGSCGSAQPFRSQQNRHFRGRPVQGDSARNQKIYTYYIRGSKNMSVSIKLYIFGNCL